MTARGAPHRAASRSSCSDRLQFVFGGVHFEIDDAEASTQPPRALPPCAWVGPPDHAALAARVQCEVQRVPRAEASDGDLAMDRAVRWVSDARGWQLTTAGVSAQVRRTRDSGSSAPARYRGRARLSSAPPSTAALVSSLASLLVSDNRGLCLHAASVEVAGGVVAFIGPSGAGKSTACRLCQPASQFSLDRLAVTRGRGGGWFAHSLPGGTPHGQSRSNRACLPLRGILAVRWAQDAGHVRSAPGASRAGLVASVRRSCFQGSCDRRSELELLASIETLCEEALVGEIYTKLNVSALPSVQRWVREATRHVP